MEKITWMLIAHVQSENFTTQWSLDNFLHPIIVTILN